MNGLESLFLFDTHFSAQAVRFSTQNVISDAQFQGQK
jgi:hypothetical protein